MIDTVGLHGDQSSMTGAKVMIVTYYQVYPHVYTCIHVSYDYGTSFSLTSAPCTNPEVPRVQMWTNGVMSGDGQNIVAVGREILVSNDGGEWNLLLLL